MCGTIRLSDKEKAQEIFLKTGVVISGKLFVSYNDTREYLLSSHRFIRAEKLQWWSSIGALAFRKISISAFKEKHIWIDVPKPLAAIAVLHQDLSPPHDIVCSFLTNETKKEAENVNPLVSKVAKLVLPIHHRILVLRPIVAA